MRRLLFLLAAVLTLLGLSAAQASELLQINLPGSIRGYQENEIVVVCPLDGTLTLTVEGNGAVWRTPAKDQPVKAGENTIVWDGLGEWLERLDETDYQMHAVLTTSAAIFDVKKKFKLERCCQALVYAMSTDETYVIGEKWGVEYDLIRDGTIMMECYHADDLSAPFYKRKVKGVGESVRTYNWDGKANGKVLPDGDYLLRFYAEDNPTYSHDVPVTIRAKAEPAAAIAPTGEIMPSEGASDEEIWEKMMLPSVVVDLKTTSHLKCYAEKSTGSTVLGTFHGQSQALEVLETDGKWALVRAWNHEEAELITGYVEQSKLKVVEPRGPYGILIDKTAQTLTVFKNGERFVTLKISTGLVDKNKLDQETAAGSFLTQEHMSDFSMYGKKYDYVIRFDGGNLLHQSPYTMESGKRNYSVGSDYLGTKASHGCVRIQPFPDEPGGINAYWLFTHIPKGTRVIVTDDAENRLTEAANVTAGKDAHETRQERTEAQPDQSAVEVTVTLGGDAVLGTREKLQTDRNALPACIAKNGASWPFSALRTVFASDDLTMINLEGVLKDDAAGEDKKKETCYRGPVSNTEILTSSSVELVNIANNHVIDYGDAGLASTLSALDQAGVAYSGYGYTWVTEINGHRIGFGGCRETVYKKTPEVIANDVAALREQGCEVILYACHWGTENESAHNAQQQKMAKACADAGVDIVIGTHPQVVQGIGEIDDTVVLWSLGNLVFGGSKSLKTYDGALARVTLLFGEEGYQGCKVTMIPILTSSSKGSNNYCPAIATGNDAIRIMKKIQADTAFTLKDEMYFAKKN